VRFRDAPAWSRRVEGREDRASEGGSKESKHVVKESLPRVPRACVGGGRVDPRDGRTCSPAHAGVEVIRSLFTR
jgi:hypothetical protein